MALSSNITSTDTVNPSSFLSSWWFSDISISMDIIMVKIDSQLDEKVLLTQEHTKWWSKSCQTFSSPICFLSCKAEVTSLPCCLSRIFICFWCLILFLTLLESHQMGLAILGLAAYFADTILCSQKLEPGERIRFWSGAHEFQGYYHLPAIGSV